jgi:hypothetical protein
LKSRILEIHNFDFQNLQNQEFLLSKSRISTFKIQNLLNSQFVLNTFRFPTFTNYDSYWKLEFRPSFHSGLNFNQSMLDTKWSQGSLSFSHLTGVTSWMFAETFGDASRNLQHLSCSRLLSSTRNGFKSIADPWAFTVCRSKVNLVVTMGLFRHHHWSGITCRLSCVWPRSLRSCPSCLWLPSSPGTIG